MYMFEVFKGKKYEIRSNVKGRIIVGKNDKKVWEKEHISRYTILKVFLMLSISSKKKQSLKKISVETKNIL